MLALLEGSHCFTIAQHKNFILSWFLDIAPHQDSLDGEIYIRTYEYFITINSTMSSRNYSVEPLIEQMVQYVKKVPNLICYKLCSDINKKGYYHGHIYLCSTEYTPYASLRKMWHHKYVPYVKPVEKTEELFVYMNSHAIAQHNTFEHIPLGYEGPRVRLVNK